MKSAPKIFREISLMGYYSPNQNIACFVLYLKIINNLLKTNVYII